VRGNNNKVAHGKKNDFEAWPQTANGSVSGSSLGVQLKKVE